MSPIWTIKILAENDFSTVLASGVRFHEASFLKALSETGTGSLEVPTRNSVFEAPLPGVLTTPIIDQQCVIEYYQDGMWRFAFFSEAVEYNMLVDGTDDRVNKLTGRGIASSLEWAFALPSGWPTLTTETKRTFVNTSRMHVWHTMFTEAKTAGFIPHITVDFTASVDSAGVTWAETDDFEVEVGKDLLALLVEFSSAAGVEWQMGQNFVLSAKQTWGTDRSTTIKMYAGKHQLEHKRQRDRKTVFNDIYVRASDGTIGHVSDATSQAKWRKRAKWLEVSSATSVTSAALVGTVNLDQLKNEVDSRTLKVLPNQPGRVVFQSYDPLGDTLTFVTSTETLAQRCVAAAIKFAADQSTDLELTLQFLIDPLAVKLQRLADRLGAGNLTTPSTSPNELDPTTIVTVVNDAIDNYTNTSIPAITVVTSASPLVYQSERHNDVRAAVQLVWVQPNNADASPMSDGDHYEIRWQLTTTYQAPITWDDASAYTWDDLLTWDRPISITYADSPQWHTMLVPFDTTTALIQELMADADYKFQVRAVDTFANVGPWSTVQNVQTVGDRIAPSQPKAAVVAASLIGVQVQHNLGKDGFGDFTLEPDLDHLDVHVGSSQYFMPTASNRVGALFANAGMIQAQIPAVATFKVDAASTVWVKVVAVDRWGNKSGPSLAASSSIILLDDAHISNLTVSKLTAGTLTAAVILAGSIKTADSGARVEIEGTGIEVFDNAGMQTLDIDSTSGDIVIAGRFKTGLMGQRIEIADAAPYSTIFFYGDQEQFAFINAVELQPPNSDRSIGLGINAGHWNAQTEDEQISSRLFLRESVQMGIIDSGQQQYGGMVRADENSYEIGWARDGDTTSKVFGSDGQLYMWAGEPGGSNGYAEVRAGMGSDGAVLSMFDGGIIDLYGKFRNYADTGAYQGLITGSLIFASVSSATISFGTTKNTAMYPIITIRVGTPMTFCVQTNDATGFTVLVGSVTTWICMFWCFRI